MITNGLGFGGSHIDTSADLAWGSIGGRDPTF